MVEAMPHHASDRLGAKAPAGEKTHLAQAFGGIGRRMTELALPDGAGTVELTGLQLAAQSRRRFGAVQAQFMLDAPVAEASDAGVDTALDEAGIGQLPALLQLIEQRVDLGGRRG